MIVNKIICLKQFRLKIKKDEQPNEFILVSYNIYTTSMLVAYKTAKTLHSLLYSVILKI